jgi:hypothetical protein
MEETQVQRRVRLEARNAIPAVIAGKGKVTPDDNLPVRLQCQRMHIPVQAAGRLERRVH